MSIASVVVVFVILWWLLLFIALPIGVNPEENPDSGNMKGAPKNPDLKKKIIATTIITVILTTAYYFAVEKGYIVFFDHDSLQQSF